MTIKMRGEMQLKLSDMIKKTNNPTQTILGKSIDGEVIESPISKFPHALIAGTVGSGKTAFMNSMLVTTMATTRPDELKFIILDTKGNEFGHYANLPYMLMNPIIDVDKGKKVLEYLVRLMEVRFKKLHKYGNKRNLDAFNSAIDSGEITNEEKMPYIVLVIDELFDLMSTHKGEVEESIKHLGAKARAVGIHMLITTQCPSRDVVTGLIKANLPTKISLKLSTATESMMILGDTGAEKLNYHGDFYASINEGKWVRGQSAFISDDEVLNVFNNLKENYPAPELIDVDNELESIRLDLQSLEAEINDERFDSTKSTDEDTAYFSYPLTLFADNTEEIESQKNKAEAYVEQLRISLSNLLEISNILTSKNISTTTNEYFIGNTSVELHYNFSGNYKQIPNLSKLEKSINLLMDVEDTSVQLRGRKIVAIIPLPKEYQIPINIKQILQEGVRNNGFVKLFN